ncbi:hypothetical protein, partial [Klebsiella aerogenes]|uniref:hypothetical protein n=1 Tax=Klebsiella aerogenes TaxID=548 RepID=UPI001952B531
IEPSSIALAMGSGRNGVADAAWLFCLLVEGGHCQPDVFTFNTLIKGFCAIGNNNTGHPAARERD